MVTVTKDINERFSWTKWRRSVNIRGSFMQNVITKVKEVKMKYHFSDSFMRRNMKVPFLERTGGFVFQYQSGNEALNQLKKNVLRPSVYSNSVSG